MAAPESRGLSLTDHARRVRREDVIYFAHQLSVMIETGVSITDALASVADQTVNPHFKHVLKDITQTVQDGRPFSAALSKHPNLFPNMMICLLKASEASGTLSIMLDRVARYLTREQQIARKVRGAVMYPLFMLAMGLATTVFLLVFVLPQFATIYENKGASLPMLTRILLGASRLAVDYWYAWLAGLAAIIGGLIAYMRSPSGARVIDGLKLRLPIVGRMYIQLYLTRSMRTMGTMAGAGVPMLDMIQITRQLTANALFNDLWDRVDACLRQGSQLSDPLTDSPLIPPSISRMVAAGEKAGRLGQVMERVADFTEHDFEEAVTRTTQFIEPLMITVMGGMIGCVAIALLLPIFSIGKVMSGN